MLRKLYLVPVLALFLVPAIANAQFEQGNYELTLSGAGSNDQDWTTGAFSVQGSLGYFTSKELELGVRQVINWADGGSAWSGQTQAFLDYHFDMDRWQPFIGANIGYVYGDNVDDAWIAGPEGGVKYFVNSTTFIGASVAYEFNLEEGFDDGGFFYTLGIGFKW